MKDANKIDGLRVLKPMLVGWISVLMLVLGFGTWAMGTTLAGAVIATGVIKVQQDRQVIQHPEGGIIASIAVANGDGVASGDSLIQLDPQYLNASLTIIETRLFEVMARRDRLRAERNQANLISFSDHLLRRAEEDAVVAELLDDQAQHFETNRLTRQREKQQLRQRQDQINSQILGIEVQKAALQAQLELISQERASQETLLNRGLAQASRVLALQREEASLHGQIGEMVASAAQAEERKIEIDLQILTRDSRHQSELIEQLRDLHVTEVELGQQRLGLRQQLDRLDIRAPVSGLVHDLAVTTQGAVIQPAQPLAFIIPQDRPLVIEARLQALNVDEVYQGSRSAFRLRRLIQPICRILRARSRVSLRMPLSIRPRGGHITRSRSYWMLPALQHLDKPNFCPDAC